MQTAFYDEFFAGTLRVNILDTNDTNFICDKLPFYNCLPARAIC